MIITRKSIARRTFLRGAGATLALPFLDAMTPALALPEQGAEVARRFSIIYSPNGMNMKDWTPTDTGTDYKLSPTLEPLAPYRDRMLVLSGLNNNEGDARQGEGDGNQGIDRQVEQGIEGESQHRHHPRQPVDNHHEHGHQGKARKGCHQAAADIFRTQGGPNGALLNHLDG